MRTFCWWCFHRAGGNAKDFHVLCPCRRCQFPRTEIWTFVIQLFVVDVPIMQVPTSQNRDLNFCYSVLILVISFGTANRMPEVGIAFHTQTIGSELSHCSRSGNRLRLLSWRKTIYRGAWSGPNHKSAPALQLPCLVCLILRFSMQ